MLTTGTIYKHIYWYCSYWYSIYIYTPEKPELSACELIKVLYIYKINSFAIKLDSIYSSRMCSSCSFRISHLTVP